MTHPPQQILVRVDCKERLPKIGDYYFVEVDTKQDSILNTICEYGLSPSKNYFWDIFNIQHFGTLRYGAEVIAWYEPATRIVLTVEEYEKLKQKQFQLGYLDARSEMEEEDFDL